MDEDEEEDDEVELLIQYGFLNKSEQDDDSWMSRLHIDSSDTKTFVPFTLILNDTSDLNFFLLYSFFL